MCSHSRRTWAVPIAPSIGHSHSHDCLVKLFTRQINRILLVVCLRMLSRRASISMELHLRCQKRPNFSGRKTMRRKLLCLDSSVCWASWWNRWQGHATWSKCKSSRTICRGTLINIFWFLSRKHIEKLLQELNLTPEEGDKDWEGYHSYIKATDQMLKKKGVRYESHTE